MKIISVFRSKSFSLLTILVLVVFGLIFSSPNARAWQVHPQSGSHGQDVVMDKNGDVIAAGTFEHGPGVVKLSGTTGAELWHYISFASTGSIDVVVNTAGDVIATGQGGIGGLTVTKLSGADGTVIWRGNAIGNALALDANEDVVVAGSDNYHFRVAKLSGATGAVLWNQQISGTSESGGSNSGNANAVAVDSIGNVVAVGEINYNFATIKFSGSNGAVVWRQEINGTGPLSDVFDRANTVAIDRAGDVVVVGGVASKDIQDFAVVKYAGATGAERWRQMVDGTAHFDDEAHDVVIDPDGDVIAAGDLWNHWPNSDFSRPQLAVIKFDGTNGESIWSSDGNTREEKFPVYGRAYALSINSYGNVVVAGQYGDFPTVIKLWGSSGGLAWRYQDLMGSNPFYGVAMDDASDVAAVGQSNDGKFRVIKLRKDGSDYTGQSDSVPDVVQQYAPVVYLHPNEQHWPASADWFIKNSELRWARNNEFDDSVQGKGTIDSSRLGSQSANPYTWTSKPYKAFELTRPYEDKPARAPGLDLKEGFFLDLGGAEPTVEPGTSNDDDLHKGFGSASPDSSIYKSAAPVYYDYRPGKYITYWFFYPYNEFKWHTQDVVQAHEGDWERISVKLDDNNRPQGVNYYRHNDPVIETYLIWDLVPEKVGDHPVVYSALGSHGSYPEPGPHTLKNTHYLAVDQADKGRMWHTKDGLVLNVRVQPWYGFGGAWGEVGDGPPLGQEVGLGPSEYTGPVGPSCYKKPSPWYDDGCLVSTPPSVTISTPSEGSSRRSHGSATGLAADAESGVQQVRCTLLRSSDNTYWNGTAWTPTPAELPVQGTTNWTFSLPSLAHGAYRIRAAAVDYEGNTAYTAWRTFNIDTIAPKAVVTNPVASYFYRNLAQATGTATDQGSGVRQVRGRVYQWNGTAWPLVVTETPAQGTSNWMLNLPTLSHGRYAFQSVAVDKVGNTSYSPWVLFSIDQVAPTVSITLPKQGISYTSIMGATGTAADNGSGVAWVQGRLARLSDNFYWNGSSWTSTRTSLSAMGTSTWSFTFPTLAPGRYYFQALARDRVGNTVYSGFVNFTKLSGTSAPMSAAMATASPAALSSASASVDSIQLKWTNALDAASVSDVAHYTVQINGAAVTLENSSYRSADKVVILAPVLRTLTSGANVKVLWHGLRDAQGRALADGQWQGTVR